MQHHHLTASEWDALAKDPEFQALLRARRRFIVPSTIFFLLFYFALLAGIGYDPALMERPVWGSLNLAYAFGFTQFLMAWLLLALYMREARTFDTRARALVDRAVSELAK
ncbi:MAG TPA: DUF485 domain-containing protein [Candidatus Baltobacteraceae bacterium]|nr:DUF485 domain-containing protein [Candidatus Baltobacteraceae bacterium]